MSPPTNNLLVIADLPPASPTAESFRALRTNTQYASGAGEEGYRVVAVTSSQEGEGKSTVAVNLAVSYAQQGKRTLLVDADLRRPVLHRVLNVAGRSGLSTYLSQESSLVQVAQKTRIEHLWLVPAGHHLANPAEMLSSPRMEKLLSEALADYDMVVIDTPPVLPVTDAQIIAAQSQGVLLVVKSGRVKRDEASQAKQRLEHVKANIIGVVLSGSAETAAEKRFSRYVGPF